MAFESRPDSGAEASNLTEVPWAAEGILRQQASFLHANHRERLASFDFHRDINVTVPTILAAGNGTLHIEVPNPAPPKLRFVSGKLQPNVVEGDGHNDRCLGVLYAGAE